MIIKKTLCLSLVWVLSNPVAACINSYAFDLGREGISQDQAKQKLAKINQKELKTYQQQNDYGVLLIYAHQYSKAIQVFQKIEKEHPNIGKTAANLGTAYELNGQLDMAQKWIQQGMQRDSNIHEGSEWIHVKILQAHIEQKTNAKWIQDHDVLGLDFGDKEYPIPYVMKAKYQDKSYRLATVLEHSKIQMNQRLQFVRADDPIVGQILFNMANIEILERNWNDHIIATLYDLAKYSGYDNQTLLQKRANYVQQAPWYILFGNVIKAYFISLIA